MSTCPAVETFPICKLLVFVLPLTSKATPALIIELFIAIPLEFKNNLGVAFCIKNIIELLVLLSQIAACDPNANDSTPDALILFPKEYDFEALLVTLVPIAILFIPLAVASKPMACE